MSTGRVQYFGFAAPVTPEVAAMTPPTFVYKGIVTGGNHNLKSEPIPQVGVGSYKPFGTRPGLASGGGSVNFDVTTDMKALLVSYGIRTAGVLPQVAISCGNTALAINHLYAMCTGWGLKCEAKGKLTGNFSWLTRKGAEVTGAQTQSITAAATAPVFSWYEIAMTGITGLEIRSFDIAVKHKVELDPVMTSTAPVATLIRLADAFADGGQDYVDLKMTLRQQAGTPHLPLADALAAIASVVITFTSGAATAVVTLSNVWLSEKNEDFSQAAVANKGISFQAEDIVIA